MTTETESASPARGHTQPVYSVRCTVAIRGDGQSSGFWRVIVWYPDNGLMNTYLALLREPITADSVTCSGSTGEVASDYGEKEALREVLAPCIQIAGGRMPRCRELLSLVCEYGVQAPGHPCIQWRHNLHHKGKRPTNRKLALAWLLQVQIEHQVFNLYPPERPDDEGTH
jgi:hypothetical protein